MGNLETELQGLSVGAHYDMMGTKWVVKEKTKTRALLWNCSGIVHVGSKSSCEEKVMAIESNMQKNLEKAMPEYVQERLSNEGFFMYVAESGLSGPDGTIYAVAPACWIETTNEYILQRAASADAELVFKYFGIGASEQYQAPLTRALLDLETDIEGALFKAGDIEERLREIKEILDKYPGVEKRINMDKCRRSVEIRRDFASALKTVKNGSDLAPALGYSFFKEDIMNLAELHKNGRFRKKIEDLLEDCNFHQEAGDFAERNYDCYIK
jgi:hypothetical protein